MERAQAKDPEDGPIDKGTEILSQVVLKSLTVSPSSIDPFGVAMLRWGASTALDRRFSSSWS